MDAGPPRPATQDDLPGMLELALGAGQPIVISGHHDAPKRAMLAAAGHAVVSGWWLAPLTP